MKPLKIGERVRIKKGPSYIPRCGEKGTVIKVDEFSVLVQFADGFAPWYHRDHLIRLIKKKKPLGVKEYEQISERMIGGIKSVAVTRQQLAKAWDKFVWGNNQIYRSADSALFDAFCKKIGFNEGER